jgi:hypothetical protein
LLPFLIRFQGIMPPNPAAALINIKKTGAPEP